MQPAVMNKRITYPVIIVLVLTSFLVMVARHIDKNIVVLDSSFDEVQIKPKIQPVDKSDPYLNCVNYTVPKQISTSVVTTPYPLRPLRPSDWGAKLPSYNVSEEIRNTDWWKAAAFLELDFRQRPFDYKCKRKATQGNWLVCLDGKWNIKPPCLVYSFGIGFDFSFDDDMTELGCEVHSFDPSMGMKDHIRNTSVHFHDLGLGGETIEKFNPRKDMYVQNQQTWTIMTLGSIMAALGHKGRTIDVLKIDVEGHEWGVIDYLIENGLLPQIKQFSLEYHLFPDWPKKSEYTKLLGTYKRLSDNGFKKFYTGIHPLFHDPEKFNIQADVGYVNFRYGMKQIYRKRS